MRTCWIGIGLCSLACGEPSSSTLEQPARETRDALSPAAEVPTTAAGADAAPASVEPSHATVSEAPATALPVAETAAKPNTPAMGMPPPIDMASSVAPTPESSEPAPNAADATSSTPGPVDAATEPPAPAVETSDTAAPGTLPDDALTLTVSLTFDDTNAEQVEAASILEAHGLRGTFYVNSPRLHRATARPETDDYMSIADVLDLQANGHDIGGHTLGHLSLTDVPEAERIREIMGDRAQLVRLGLDARSFAYPYGHVEADSDRSLGRRVLEIARGSGYSSARDTNGFNLDDCDRGPETVPPEDPFILRSVRSVNEPPGEDEPSRPLDTAETLLGWMDRAARCGGGWLPLIFHQLRDDCSAPDAPEGYCFDFSELDRLGASLATGLRCPGGARDGDDCYRVSVSTVAAVIGATELAPAPEVLGLRNPSFERALDSGETECVRDDGASRQAVFSHSTQLAHSGQASERLAISSFVAPAEIGVERDYGECAVFSSEGRVYELSLYYRADPEAPTPRLRFVTYRLTADYEWDEWDSGEAFSARSPGQWVRLAFTTTPVPEDSIAISFGLRQESAGTINVDDLDAVAGD